MRKNSKQPLDAKTKERSDLDASKAQITDEITLKTPPVANQARTDASKSGVNAQVSGIGDVSQKLSVSPYDEFVSGGGYVWLAQYIRALPFFIDDITRDFGDDLYERMMLDEQVFSAIGTLKDAILAGGVTITTVKDQAEERPHLGLNAGKRTIKTASQKSKDIAEFCQRSVEGIQRGFDDWLYEMLDALAYGNRISEQIYQLGSGQDEGRVTLKALKVKPRTAYSFVVDVFMNVLGIIGLIPGQGAPIIVQSILGEPNQIPNLVPRQKFAVLTNRPAVGDPRGQSELRAAYDPWWGKKQTEAEMLKYIAQFAVPSLWGTTPDGAQAYIDPTTGLKTTPEQALLSTMTKMRNGSVGAYPFGTEINPIPVSTEGKPILDSLDRYDRRITKAVLNQTLATEEGKHQARAAADAHRDIMDLKVQRIKVHVARMIRTDVLRELLKLNEPVFGVDGYTELLPIVNLGDIGQNDFDGEAKAVSTLVSSGFLHTSQYPEIDERLGLPERDIDAQNAEIARNVELEEQAAQQVPQAAAKAASSARGKQMAGPMNGNG